MTVISPDTSNNSGNTKTKTLGRSSKEPHAGGGKSKLSDKYKYVRFVEKKKVIRRMRQLQRELQESDPSNAPKVNDALTELRKDLMYIEKFPGNKKYIALFPSEGQLSEDCRRKQQEIRAMIVNLTKKAYESANKRRYEAVKDDDFFASVDNVEKPAKNPAIAESRETPKPSEESLKEQREVRIHPSWAAKTQNDKLTGSLAQAKFEGSRVVFDEDD
jgi:hypothetical protein